MENKLSGRAWFYTQPRLPVPECAECDALKVYRLAYSGQYVIETEIDSGLGGEAVEIDQITDIHFNYVSISDEEDSEVMATRAVRKWNMEGESVKSAIHAMDAASFSDQTVITGDVLDYLSRGTILLMNRHILSRDPDVLMTLGGHELTKQMETYMPDETPLEERYGMLKEVWPHDIFYHSKEVGGKVIAVCLDNSLGKFLGCQIERLKEDIKRAREQKKIILVFMHEPISPRDRAGKIPPLWKMKGAGSDFDFGERSTIGAFPADEATDEVYALLTENADVIKGFFCGHRHSMFHTRVNATYKDGGEVKKVTIPQLVAPGNPYLDHSGIVVRIFVK